MYELGIIGAGNMAEAIAVGAIKAGILTPAQIVAADPSPQRRGVFSGGHHIRALDDNAEVARSSRTILLSVKPQQMAEALSAIGRDLSVQTLVVSIAAGISTRFIEKHLGPGTPWRVVRVMPNTPMLVGEGMSGIARGNHASDDDMAAVSRLFKSAGDVIEVTEEQMDAVTALSGSGPAYFFLLVEQMIAAGVDMGLSPAQARQLAAKTALGAARMLVTSPDAPEELRRKVTSPGGTTHAAITLMQERGVPQAIADAIKAAERRGRELGKLAREVSQGRNEDTMGNGIKNLLMGGAGATTRFGDFGLMLLRVGVGLGIAIGHGWGKVYQDGHVGPPEQFVGGVTKMGLPAPTAMAWMAALTEFLGGLLLAAGLLTRPVALALACSMAVAAFVAHQSDPLFPPPGKPGKEFALLYLLPFLLFVFTGAGRFSLDKFLRKSAAAAKA